MDTALEWRGGQRQLSLLVAGLEALGHRQVVACPGDSPLAARVPTVEPVRAGRHPATPARLRALVRTLRPDVVAAHTSHAHSLCVAAGLRPVVHRRVDRPPAWWSVHKYRRPRGYVCVSVAAAAGVLALGVPATRVYVVHSGVAPFVPVPPAALGEGPVVLAVGALVEHKGHEDLAAAAVGLPARVLVAGEGPLRARLELTRLELLGQRDDVPALLAAADVFVHPSRTEGLGQAIAEAMGAGVPVVATRAGGVPELVEGVGLLVEPGDPMALRRALVDALAGRRPDPEAGRRRVAERFSVRAMVEGTERAYTALIGG